MALGYRHRLFVIEIGSAYDLASDLPSGAFVLRLRLRWSAALAVQTQLVHPRLAFSSQGPCCRRANKMPLTLFAVRASQQRAQAAPFRTRQPYLFHVAPSRPRWSSILHPPPAARPHNPPTALPRGSRPEQITHVANSLAPSALAHSVHPDPPLCAILTPISPRPQWSQGASRVLTEHAFACKAPPDSNPAFCAPSRLSRTRSTRRPRHLHCSTAFVSVTPVHSNHPTAHAQFSTCLSLKDVPAEPQL